MKITYIFHKEYLLITLLFSDIEAIDIFSLIDGGGCTYDSILNNQIYPKYTYSYEPRNLSW